METPGLIENMQQPKWKQILTKGFFIKTTIGAVVSMLVFVFTFYFSTYAQLPSRMTRIEENQKDAQVERVTLQVQNDKGFEATRKYAEEIKKSIEELKNEMKDFNEKLYQLNGLMKKNNSYGLK